MIRGTYQSVLKMLTTRRRAYQLCFGKSSPAGQVVLEDLVRFCRACESCWGTDARHHARLEGRREVILRIGQMMNLTPDQLFVIYGGMIQKENAEANDE